MDAIVENNLDAIRKLFKKYGAERAYLFGSAAVDETHEKSDVDFLFKFPTGLHYEIYSNNYFDLLHDLQKLLNKEVDLVAEETLSNPYLIKKINSQKIQLL